MFQLYENFKVIDDNKQPYSIEVERHTAIDNLHAKVENGEFGFNSIGNRLLFKTPALSDFILELKFGFTCLYEFNPNFTVIFHYNKKTRQGEGIRVCYDLSHKLLVSYITLDKMKVKVLDSVTLDDFVIEEDYRYRIAIEVNGSDLRGRIENRAFSFTVREGKGYLAIERKNYIGQWLISEFEITSRDEMQETVLCPEMTVEIPLLNGGDIPYKFTWCFKRINERLYLDYSLSGGTSSRKLNREDRPGQYVAEKDQITRPYVKVRNGSLEEQIYLFNDIAVLVDPNIYWDCLKLYWKIPQMPIMRRCAIDGRLIGEETTVTYGYERFMASGYVVQEGGPSEFVYDLKGNLLYGGPALREFVYELCSPADKKAISLIPKDCYHREEVVDHLQNNHYFSVGEDIYFDFYVRTKLKTDYIGIRAEIRDIYDSEVLAVYTPQLHVGDWKFGYREVSCSIRHTPLNEKLYRVIFLVAYGDSLVDSYERVFEVYDISSSLSPAMVSGLPFVFSMPNEQKWLERNSFDLWNPLPSCDVEHYISAITDTPIEAERRRVWQVIKPFKRQWFAWLANRTCRDWQLENHLDVVKNCDYLHYQNAYTFLHWLKCYTYSPEMIELLREFLALHPEFAQKLSFTLPEEGQEAIEMLVDEAGVNRSTFDFSFDNLKEFMDLCCVEWFDFVLQVILKKVKAQDQEIREINSGFKRTGYGPFNQYTSATASYHSMRISARLPEDSLAEIYNGYFIFEDYPYSCSYQTYRGAFCLMSILLHIPNLVLYPEQYKGGRLGGCIDGAVKFAHAPMGGYIVENYQTSTHSFEFVFNTPQRIRGGYRYWDTYGFHRPDYSNEASNMLAKDWKNVLDFKPAKPLKTIGFVAEYTSKEDIFDVEIDTLASVAGMKNRSEGSHGFLYDCSREAGLNAGFVMKFETLQELQVSECDILFLPTLTDAGADVISEIRRLYQEGVSLVAVSDITGLEDIFGVKPMRRTVAVDTLEYQGAEENVYPMETDFYYEAVDAEVLVTANGEPVVLRRDNAVLVNAPIMDIGYECYEGFAGKSKKNVSPLMKESLIQILRELASPDVLGENVGVTLFETEKGEMVLMAIDYTPFDNREHGKRTAVVSVNMDGLKDVAGDREILRVWDQDGDLREIRFDILPHETVFIRCSLGEG